MLDDRFWAKVKTTEGCWLWRGALRRDGYGLFWNRETKRWDRAHRVAYEGSGDPIPTGMSVLHHCDNRACVRPDHLFVGTQADNMADMTTKGRRSTGPRHAREQRGEANPMARLTAIAVAKIRAMGVAGYVEREIADQFSVNPATIGLVLRGVTWKGIEPSAPLPPVERLRYSPKLGPALAKTIRERYTGQRGDRTRLAREYGVSRASIGAILDGRSYAKP